MPKSETESNTSTPEQTDSPEQTETKTEISEPKETETKTEISEPKETETKETEPETKTEPQPETKQSELDWLFNLIDSIQKGTFNPVEWPEFFKLPTPPQIVLIEMLELAKKYAAVKVKMKEFEYEQQLNESRKV